MNEKRPWWKLSWRWTLFIVIIILLLGWSAREYMLGPFSWETPSSIELKLRLYSRPDKDKSVTLTIDSPSAIREIIAVLKTGTVHGDHKCAATGVATLKYSLASRQISILPGHNDDRYEFRHHLRNYYVERRAFLAALKNAGVDLKLIAKTPKDLPSND